MSTPIQSPTAGIEPLIAQPPVIIDGQGQERRMRRLGLKDVFGLMRLLGKLSDAGQQKLVETFKGAQMNAQEIAGAILVLGLAEIEHDVYAFLGDLVGVDAETFADPELFPLEAQFDLVLKLIGEHPDIDAFFTKLTAAMKNPQITQRIGRLFGNKPSTESKPATDG